MVFLGIALILLKYFPPSLLFSVATTTGGDTGAHIYTPWYLRYNLLPKGLTSGWSPGWYGGFPLLHFYFPLVALFQALMSFIIPYEVAFKLGTVLGTFFLPVAAYIMFRLMRFAWPAPALAAIASLAFLFMDSYSIYGGNIKSNLSGEYSFGLSVGLVLVFIGLMYRLATEQKGRPLLTAGVLAMAVLSHLLPVVVALLLTPVLLFWAIREHGIKPALRRFATVYALALALTSFWSIPFLVRLSYTTDMRWSPLEGWGPVFPREIWPYLAGFVLASAIALLRRDRRMTLFVVMSCIGIALYLFLPPGSVWNGRFLPFFYLAVVLSSAYFVSTVISGLARAVSVRRMGAGVVALSLAFTVGIGVWTLGLRETTPIDNWITDNYTGYESRRDFPTFKALNDRLAALPPGRVFWEPNDQLVKFGTPIALMSIPYWSGQPTMEGINYESSMTTPFHFITASEVADKPSNPIPGLPYRTLDLTRGARHMELLDVRYYLAYTQPAKDAAARAGLAKLEEFGDLTLFSVESPGQVIIPAKRPVPFNESGSKWIERNIKWFSDLGNLDQPLIRASNEEWAKVANLPPPSEARSIDAQIEDNQISFRTDAVGQPHWIKTSYFPNWKVEGAEGPYLASPSMMMVVPTQSVVRLYYARTWVEWLGLFLTLGAFVLLAVPRLRRAIVRSTAVGPVPDLAGAHPLSNDTAAARVGAENDGETGGVLN